MTLLLSLGWYHTKSLGLWQKVQEFYYFGPGFHTFNLLTTVMSEDTACVLEDPGLPLGTMQNVLLLDVVSPRGNGSARVTKISRYIGHN